MKCPPPKKKSNKLGNILLWKESSIAPDSFSFNRDTFLKTLHTPLSGSDAQRLVRAICFQSL